MARRESMVHASSGQGAGVRAGGAGSAGPVFRLGVSVSLSIGLLSFLLVVDSLMTLRRKSGADAPRVVPVR